MKPHPRIRKTVKWGGLLATIVLVPVWMASLLCWTQWGSARGDRVYLGSGCVYATYVLYSSLTYPDGWRFGRTREPMLWRPIWGRETSYSVAGLVVERAYLRVPLWALLLLSVIASGLAWRLDALARRRADRTR